MYVSGRTGSQQHWPMWVPPGTEKALGGNYCQKQCKPDVVIDCRKGFIPTPKKDGCMCLPGLVPKEQDCVCPNEEQYFDGEKCVCPTGQVWKENQCVCPNEQQVFDGNKCVCFWEGQVLHGDDCVCPPGTEFFFEEGGCVPVPTPNCPSGVKTSKCYTLTFGNGQLFGYNSSAGFYTASPSLQFSKFQFCADEDCSSPTEDIKTGMPFNLQEIVGQAPPNSTQRTRTFVSNAKNEGPYLTRTTFFITSERFIIAKWPGDKHCLGSYDTGVGVGLTYKAGIVGATVLPDDQSCIIFKLTEVPCDIRACIEENKTGTPAPGSGESSSNASMPLW